MYGCSVCLDVCVCLCLLNVGLCDTFRGGGGVTGNNTVSTLFLQASLMTWHRNGKYF